MQWLAKILDTTSQKDELKEQIEEKIRELYYPKDEKEDDEEETDDFNQKQKYKRNIDSDQEMTFKTKNNMEQAKEFDFLNSRNLNKKKEIEETDRELDIKELPNEQKNSFYEEKIRTLKEALTQQKIDFEIEKAILAAKGRNVKSIKALIDTSEVDLKPDGSMEGLDLEELKKSYPYLFETEKTSTYGTGMEKGNKSGKDGFKKQFEKALFH